MLLSLPILHLARVNPLLLLHNKPALFIQLPAYNITGAVKLFLLVFSCVILRVQLTYYGVLLSKYVSACRLFYGHFHYLIIQIFKGGRV